MREDDIRGRAAGLALTLLAALLAAAPLHAFQGPEQEGPVVGLALSGGGARGLAHIGLIQELEARGIRVHLVTGTSMGALVGALYALGLPGDSLEAVARRFNEENLFSDQVPRRFLSPDQRLFDERLTFSLPIRGGRVDLPGGALEGSQVIRALEREFWAAQGIGSFDRLPRPFTAVATDIRTGTAVPLRGGGLAEAVRASVAIPGLLEPVEYGERLLVDGALVRNLPAQDARALGAELLICSDVAVPPEEREYDSMVDVLSRAINLDSRAELERQYAECDVVLNPVSREMDASDFQELDRWLAVGRQAVREGMGEITGAFARRRDGGTLTAFLRRRQARIGPLLPDSVRVTEVRFPALTAEERVRPARGALGVVPGEVVDAVRLDRALAALQATQLYSHIAYELERRPGAEADDPLLPVALVVELEPAQRDRLGVGMRFDDTWKASVLLSATLMNRLGYGASTRFDLRLGEELQFQLTHFAGRGITSTVGYGLSAGYQRAPLFFADGGRRFFELRSELLYLSGQLGLVESRGGVLAVEVRGEQARERPVLGTGVSTRERRYATVALVGFRDSFDRAVFPTRGSSIRLRSEWASRAYGSGADFRHHHLDLRLALPLAERWAAHLEVYGGVASGADLPLHRHFFPGGSVTSAVLSSTHPVLHGVEAQALWGRAAQVARLALQWEVSPGWFVVGTANAGDARDRWVVEPDRWIGGWGLTLGTVTPLGPARVTVSGRGAWDDLLLSVNLGPVF